jgi:cell division protein FtsL
LSAWLEAEQLRGQGLETKITEANATIAGLQKELISQKSAIKDEFEKLIEEQHKLSAANTSLSIRNQSLELKVQNAEQMLEAVRK